MIINDNVYGSFQVNKDILLDIIHSPTLQRLKGIAQHGMPEEYYPKEGFSRFEHSLGVMHFLKMMGAGIEEQTAGLIHDVSHTAFSHVVDSAIGDPTKENYQDNVFLEYVTNSEIPKILRRHGMKFEEIANIDSFGLLERDAPSLCADRVDYCLRDLANMKPRKNIENLVNNLSSKSGQILFKSKKAAKEFGEGYAMLQRNYWGGNETRARYYILADAIKTGLKKGYITKEDLHKTDQEVINLLKQTKNKQILNDFKMLKYGFKIKNVSTGGIVLEKKFRYVDPEVFIDNKIVSLSSISEDYKKLLDKEKENYNKEVRVEISH